MEKSDLPVYTTHVCMKCKKGVFEMVLDESFKHVGWACGNCSHVPVTERELENLTVNETILSKQSKKFLKQYVKKGRKDV